MKTIIVLIAASICASLPAYGRDPFPIDRQMEVISFGHQVLMHDRMKVLFERPIDDKFGYTMLDVRVAPGCFNWELRVKASPLGAFHLVIIRQTAVWCADVTEVEKALAEYFGEATSWRMDGEVLILQAAGSDMRLAPVAGH